MKKRLSRGIVVLAAAAILGATARAGAAMTPEPIVVETHGVLTGPVSAAGTFSLSGLVSDSGTYTESFRFAGTTIHVTKTLVGSKGTVTLTGQGVVRWTSPTTATFFAGHWRIEAGTGSYADLQGGGSPGAVGSANLATGVVEVVHAGQAQIN